MYTRVINPTIDLYDEKTHELLGVGTFTLPNSEEKKLLNLVNYGSKPQNLLIVNARLYNPSADYEPSTPDKSLRREGVIKAKFMDSYTGEYVPIEVHIKFDSRPRGITPGDPYNYISVEFNDIDVESVKPIQSTQ